MVRKQKDKIKWIETKSCPFMFSMFSNISILMEVGHLCVQNLKVESQLCFGRQTP